MKTLTKLLICAILSMSIGVAAASPLLITELDIKPFYRIPEGPKAAFNIDVIYADFDVQEHASTQVSGGQNLSIVNYQVVLNITNLSDKRARIGSIDFHAAKDVIVTPSFAGGQSVSSGGGKSGGGGNSFIEGLYLDDEWLNVTWLPDSKWPTFPFDPMRNYPTTIPDLPENATYAGQWIEGIHIWQWHNTTTTDSGTAITWAHYIFVNGTWVDVTGRIRTDNPIPYVHVVNTLINNRVNFNNEYYGNYANESELVKELERRTNMSMPSGLQSGNTEIWAGEGGFNCYWEPYQSRLITVKGTIDVGVNLGLESLSKGKITLHATATSYLYDREEMKTDFVNTFLYSTYLQQIQVEKTANGYLYNPLLIDDQCFQPDEFGVEVIIKPRS